MILFNYKREKTDDVETIYVHIPIPTMFILLFVIGVIIAVIAL